jgi:hypothetical protein
LSPYCSGGLLLVLVLVEMSPKLFGLGPDMSKEIDFIDMLLRYIDAINISRFELIG